MRHIVLMGMVLLVCCGVARAADTEAQSAGSSASFPVNQFGADLYSHLAQKEGNLFCSPLSIYTVLQMVQDGAQGETRNEMVSVLHRAEGGGGILGTLDSLRKADTNFELHIANAIWAQNGFSCLPAYRATLTNDYHCDFFNVDFMNAGAASQSINDWVSKATSGKIADLFPPGALKPGAKLVLTNAIYFHADWERQFSADRTSPGDFHVGGGVDAQPRAMMRQHGSFPFMRGDGFDALELPYKGGDIGMIILLPRAVDGLKGLEGKYSDHLLSDVTQKLKPEFAEVTVPKFTFSFEDSLPGVLEAMGIHAAFEAGAADFSGIDGRRDLFLSDVRHKAFVAVDEAGTTAAAATGGVMMPTAVPMPNLVFNADHPFMFVIVDHRSGAALFVGRVWDPGEK